MMTDVVEGITGDIDGYLYWFDGSIQKYRYYNIVSITGEPEYMSEFDVLPCGENIWIWLHGQEGTVEVTGVPEQKAPFTLVKGWNVIGCTGLEDVPMATLISELDATNADYDGYIYWLSAQAQRYLYYNILEKTNEPEYPSEFDVMHPHEVYWVYCFDEGTTP
jgi:hypothetical protein